MDLQTIIVIFILSLAAIYLGFAVVHKARDMRARSSCGSNCGCGQRSGSDI
ncbi:MAG: FeoB-associated Cys-rich membrane protein [Acidobacteria bacterium]|nr:FeoB-associated Cys-rich membrane protein [Acidobacteriota bacterium]